MQMLNLAAGPRLGGIEKVVGAAFPEAIATMMRRSYAEVVERQQPLCWLVSVPAFDRSFLSCCRALFPFSTGGQMVNLIAGLLMPVNQRLI